jgi:hypothetical protein
MKPRKPPIPKAVLDVIRELGRQGGKTRARRLSPARRREIARQAVMARWHPADRPKRHA